MTERVKIRGGFTAIPNDLLRSDELDLDEKGMLALIASHADGWEFRRDDMLRKSGCSKDKYYRIIKSLKAKGHLEIVSKRTKDGSFSGGDWIVDFAPCPENQDVAPCPENQDKPCPENPDTANQDTKKNKTQEEKKKNNKGVLFSEFWQVWPNKVSKIDAEKAWKKLKPADRELATKYAAQWFAKWQSAHPSASKIQAPKYLNGKRWQDLEGTSQQSAPADPRARLKPKAEAILKNQRFMFQHISTQDAAQMISLGMVTPDQCRSVGVQF